MLLCQKNAAARLDITPARLRIAVAAVLALPRPVASTMFFTSNRGTVLSEKGFKSQWQRSMRRWAAQGGERFREHDIRTATASDAATDARAQDILDHSNVSTTRRAYRARKARNVEPLR